MTWMTWKRKKKNSKIYKTLTTKSEIETDAESTENTKEKNCYNNVKYQNSNKIYIMKWIYFGIS